jgi:two-component system OmpR family sensor kinase
VIVRARERDGTVVIEPEDECGGFADGLAEAMFTPFVGGETEREGSGLGLAIAREAMEAHHGRISMRTSPGHGCALAITLPAPWAISGPREWRP